MPSVVKEDGLSDGQNIPVIGLGCINEKKKPPAEVENIIKKAIDLGYRYFNCSWENREAIGRAIRQKIKDGVVKREDLFITSKIRNDDDKRADKLVVQNCKWTLKKMGLTYLDLLLVHSSDEHQQDFSSYIEVWRRMEECVDLGLCHYIGVSNFNIQQLSELVEEGRIKPTVNQMELHVNVNPHTLREYCKSHEIRMVAYSPFGTAGKMLYGHDEEDDIEMADIDLRSPLVDKIADKYEKTNFQVALRFLIDVGYIPTPCVTTEAHLSENIDVFDFQLTSEEIQTLERLNFNVRKCCTNPLSECRKESPIVVDYTSAL